MNKIYISNLVKKLSISEYLFIFLIASILAIGIVNLDYPLDLSDGDSARDYLIARSISRGESLPLVGPWNAGFGTMVNSPFYYYLLALFLFIYDSYIYLNLINLLFFLASIIIYYLIAKKLFNKYVALISSLAFVSVPVIYLQSMYIWQPHLMYPFYLLSFLFLIKAYQDRSNKFVHLGIVSIIIAGALHNSAYSFLPVFLVLSMWIIYKNKPKLSQVFKPVITVVATFLVFYAPNIILFYKQENKTQASFSGFLKLNYAWDQLLAVFKQFLSFLSFSSIKIFHPLLFLYFLYLLFIIIYAFDKNKKTTKTLAVVIFIAVQPFLAFVLFGVKEFHIHYFSVVFAPLYIFAVGLIFSLDKIKLLKINKGLLRVIQFIFIAYVLFFSSSAFALFNDVDKFERPNSYYINQATDKIKDTAIEIKKTNNYEDLNFFDIIVYKKGPYGVRNYIFYLALEDKLNTDFIDISKSGLITDSQKKNYVFLVCINKKSAVFPTSDCKEHLRYRLNYLKVNGGNLDSLLFEDIYKDGPLNIFLTKTI
ncbi:MAG: glycosyltransferase family 39 protein [Candidatus Spechtbacterales bacterium]